MTEAAPRLRIENLGKSFPARSGHDAMTALEGVDIDIRAGEFVSIIGPSGCGKSTLFNMLAGLIKPSAGKIYLDGGEPDSLLGKIGYMPQKDLLMPWRTVLDNVTLGLEMDGTRRRKARAQAMEELPRFGLKGFEQRWPSSLSGGMRQRAALLRTFLAGREVMLLDEPFGALDALTRQAMQEWLLELWATDRKTVVFITHDVEEAVYLSDRVHVMSGRPGRVELSLDITLPRPRSYEMTVSPEFNALKQQLLEPLHEASRKQMEEVR
jgi:ABC-type nitrate/sulfonate/bicarbonate transport system ATPase subunit